MTNFSTNYADPSGDDPLDEFILAMTGSGSDGSSGGSSGSDSSSSDSGSSSTSSSSSSSGSESGSGSGSSSAGSSSSSDSGSSSSSSSGSESSSSGGSSGGSSESSSASSSSSASGSGGSGSGSGSGSDDSSSSEGSSGDGGGEDDPPPNDEGQCGKDASDEPVYYGTGELQLSTTDVSATGGGRALSHSRSYSNRRSNLPLTNGRRWMTRQQPRLLRDNGDNSVIRVVVAPRSIIVFDNVATSGPPEYVGRYGARQMLIRGTAVFKFLDSSGTLWEFHDFEQTAAPQGQLHRVTPPGGALQIEYAYVDGRLDNMQRTTVDGAETVVDKLAYAYSADLIASVTLTQKIGVASEKNLRRAIYTYDADQLQQVDQQEHDGTAWITTGSYHYRYHADGNNLLKLVLSPSAYERAKDNLLNVAAATDSQLKAYADYYYEYDSQGRVNHEEVKGGARAYSFSYERQAKVEDFNKWRTKTIETLPDQSTNTVFANFLGQVLLKERAIGQQKWIEYKVYNDEGRLTEQWTPAAVASYSVSENVLSVSATTDGLIQVTEYGSATTASESTAGDVKGHPKQQKLRKGNSGLEVTLREITYYKHLDLNGRDTYPLAEETVHQSEDGLHPSTTSYEYEWHADVSNPLLSTSQIRQRKTLMPVVTATQQGAATVDSSVQVFDRHGLEVWQRGARGFIRFKKYDQARGVVLQSIEDVDVSLMSDVPSTDGQAWSTPAGWGKHYVTDYAYDVQGRLIQTLGPLHNAIDAEGDEIELRRASWMFYKSDHETWSAQGYQKASDSSVVLVNPVSITRRSTDGMATEAIVAKYDSAPSLLDPDTDDFDVQTDWVRWSRQFYNAQGQLEKSQVYHAIPASGAGTVGTNYDETLYAYDDLGRQARVQAPDGTISRTVFDLLGRSVEAWVGTDDTPTVGAWSPDNTAGANLAKVTSTEFDAGGVGNGLVTQKTHYVDADSGNDRITTFDHDWRGRQVRAIAPSDAEGRVTYTSFSHDNANRVIAVERFLENVGTDELLDKSESRYDNRGRVYQQIRYSIEDGVLGSQMIERTWYDCCGNAIKRQPAGGGAFTKSTYDSLGRDYKTYIGFDFNGESDYAAAASLAQDNLVEQGETIYDSTGNVIATISLRRYHPSSFSVGLLVAGENARADYAASWYDALGRVVTYARYGNQGDDSVGFDRSAIARPTITSSNILVSSSQYDDSGDLTLEVDHAGRTHATMRDNAGRVTRVIQNVVGTGSPRTGTSDQNVAIDTSYGPAGRVATLTALQKNSSDDQVTHYVYGTDQGDGTPEVYRNDLLRAEIYADSDDSEDLSGNGADGLYDRIEYEYNRQGQVIVKKDQNGTCHAFGYDKLGRQVSDEATAFGVGIDQSVVKITTAFDKYGRVGAITSYDALGNEVNQVARQYDGLGQLISEEQAVTGAVAIGVPTVSYQYDYTAVNGEFIRAARRKALVYPNGRALTYDYNSVDGVGLNRVARIRDSASGGSGFVLVEYQYLGLHLPVVTELHKPGVMLTYDPDGNFAYSGLDRFDRVVDHCWFKNLDVGSGDPDAELVHLRYGYDLLGSRVYREDLRAKSHGKHYDELYGYDEAGRLKSMDRGTLNGTRTGLVGGSRKAVLEWELDSPGNWSQFREDVDGTSGWDFTQSRTHSKTNEIASISNWADPQYDHAGNMVAIPRPDDLEDVYRATWDAWGRLVELEEEYSLSSFRPIASYQYDGLNRRSVKVTYTSGTPVEARRYYFSDAWQVLEERVGSSEDAEQQFVWGIRYVDDLVLRDRPTERLYALQDVLFSVVALTDTNAIVQERFSYRPYGHSESLAPDFTSDSGTDYEWEHRFTGRKLDLESGLQINRMRHLHLQLGRWVARDPVGYQGSWPNLYAYANSTPCLATDPSGTVTVHFKEGRVTLSSASVIPLPPRLDGGLGLKSLQSFMNAGWDVDTSAFGANGCSSCSEIGIVQIVKQTANTNSNPANYAHNYSWKVDTPSTTDPTYLYNSDILPGPVRGNPQSTPHLSIEDVPGVIPTYPGLWGTVVVSSFKQEFETYVACVGQAGAPDDIKVTTSTDFGIMSQDLTDISVYGGIHWFHSYNRKANGTYSATRSITNRDARPGAVFESTISGFFHRRILIRALP
ncbi:RHS repeat domain-containing protein [Lacipirellula sp.]|uniref:RHS repeat domain-containing protein n=1 Tax=Lacipirellula sp. TaxID=2691419 RepID=UPI003D0A173F